MFFTQKTKNFHKSKRNMNDETIDFLTSCFSFPSDKRYALNKEFILSFQLNKTPLLLKNVLIITFEIMKKENNTHTSSFNTSNRC